MSNQTSSTDTETQVFQILKAVLANEGISYDDTFIDAGGDSLTAMLCISRIAAAFDVELSIEDFFFDDATIRSLAGRIDFLRSESN